MSSSEWPKFQEVPLPPYVGLNSREASQLSSGPWYRLKLTLWYIDQNRLTPNNSMIIRKFFLTAADANDEAFELAQSSQSKGESVMLADRKTIEHETLNEYAVAKWDVARVETPMDSWEFLLHRPNPYFKRNTLGAVSGLVQVIREDAKDGFQLGSPLIGRSRQGSMHTTRHPANTRDHGCSDSAGEHTSRGPTRRRRESMLVTEVRFEGLKDVQE
jgi:hypothetical protein